MKPMRKFLKIVFSIFLLLPIVFFIHLGIKLYYEPQYTIDGKRAYNQAIIKQLHFLKDEISKGKAKEMQQIFPEGFIFFNAIYGLTWCELINKTDLTHPLAKEAINEIDRAIKEVNSEEGKRTFEKNLPVEYGAFYQGWTTLLLGKKLAIIDSTQRNSTDVESFTSKCQNLADAYIANDFTYLKSYSSGTWQADNIICLAALALHDKLFEPKYTEVIGKCLEHIKANLDTHTGLIPHSLDEEIPRGSSQSLINVFLPEIDSVFARKMYVKFKDHFLDRRLGLVAIREFPKGRAGNGDIDSGPVIWDVGGVASIVGIKAMAAHKDWATAKSLRNNIEGLGYPVFFGQHKKYFFGVFPMADAFIAWSNVSLPENMAENEANNKTMFLLIALIVSSLIIWVLYIMWKKKK